MMTSRSNRYRKKPVVIEAFQWSGLPPENGHFPNWFLDAVNKQIIFVNDDQSLTIKTLEGDHRADLLDYVICGVKGELYPCKPDIFEMTYEPAD